MLGRPSFYDSGGPPRELPRTCGALAILLLAVATGCGESPEPPEPEPAPVVIDDPFLAPLPDLRTAALAHASEAVEHAGQARGVRAALRASELAGVLSLRDPSVAWLDRSRAWLRDASRDPDVEGACEAASRAIDLEARDAADPNAAYQLAFVTT